MEDAVRIATLADVPMMVEMSEQKRSQYETYQPLFWRRAADSRERQHPFLEQQLCRDDVIALVHDHAARVNGFLIAALVPSPPVYAAGLTCVIDDFCVAEHDWAHTGKALLDAAVRAARERGAVQAVVVCGHLDEPKRQMLRASGHTIASEWWVKPIAGA